MVYQLTHSAIVTPLGEIQSEEHSKSSELDIFSLPLSDSDQTQAWDFEGVVRKIRLSGKVSASSQADLMNDFISKIEVIVDGDQSDLTVFHSNFYASGTATGDFNTKIADFRWRFTTESKNIVTYDLVLVEASI